MADCIEQFFAAYAEAFRSHSRAAVLAKLPDPLVLLTAGGPVALGGEPLAANADALIGRYRQIEAAGFEYERRGARRVGAGIHLVEIGWRFLDAGGRLLYACETSYFLAGERAAEAKMMAVIAHNKEEEYQRALPPQHRV